jgi:hypothetical protein
MNLIEKSMLSLRHKEEIHLVEKEIITYDISIRKKISVLEKERRKLQRGLNRQNMKKKTEKGVSVCRRSIARRVSL